MDRVQLLAVFEEHWQTIFLALAAGAALLITAFFAGMKEVVSAWLARLTQKVKKRSYADSIERLAQFLEEFEEIQNIPEIERSIIFHGHNCGGRPTPGKPYTVRAVHGWCKDKSKEDPVERYGFELQVDGHYIRMLEGVINEGNSIQDIENMPPEAKLRKFYVAEGVRHAVVFYLGLRGMELIYLSIAKFSEPGFSEATLGEVQLKVDRMRSIMGEQE